MLFIQSFPIDRVRINTLSFSSTTMRFSFAKKFESFIILGNISLKMILNGTVHCGIVIKFEISLVNTGERVKGPPTIIFR